MLVLASNGFSFRSFFIVFQMATKKPSALSISSTLLWSVVSIGCTYVYDNGMLVLSYNIVERIVSISDTMFNIVLQSSFSKD